MQLNFPTYAIPTKTDAKGKIYIYDIIRKKHLVLTPEEWVRQHLVWFLIKARNYPKSLIALEMGLKVNGLAKRSDIVVYNKQGKPRLLVECKAASIKISQDVFNQAARYNLTLKVPYLMVTNGLQHYCCKIDLAKKQVAYLPDIPYYHEL